MRGIGTRVRSAWHRTPVSSRWIGLTVAVQIILITVPLHFPGGGTYGKRHVALTLAVAFAVFWITYVAIEVIPHARRRRRAAAGRCLHCGYDLRASTRRCPECGAKFRGNHDP